MPALRIVVVEDSLLMRRGIVTVLERAGHRVVAEAGDVVTAISAVAAQRPDCVVVDIRMPPTQTDEGIRLAHSIRSTHPHTGVLVLSHYIEPALAARLMDTPHGGLGYLLKDSIMQLTVLDDAVVRVTALGTVIDRRVVDDLLERRRTAAGIRDLSAAERRVLVLMAEGHTNSGVAGRLQISERTVDAHARAIFRKLDLTPDVDGHRRVLAVIAYLRGAAGEDPSGAS